MSVPPTNRHRKANAPGKPPVDAVRGLDLEVAEEECFGLLGPNGAGKTTTLEIMAGLLDATSALHVHMLNCHNDLRHWRADCMT